MKRINYWKLAIVLITVVGFYARLKCCYWGKPFQLHPDEPVVVDSAIDMLERHSWIANSYNRPDQIEIKCDAILFELVSRVLYHKPTYEIFQVNQMPFYLIARFLTAIFGTLLIPLSALFVGEIARGQKLKYGNLIQLFTAILIAFLSVFVTQSAYATPDIVLTFFVVFFSLNMLYYVEYGRLINCICCALTIGISITIKYPGAILCVPFALMVVYRSLVEKKRRIS